MKTGSQVEVMLVLKVGPVGPTSCSRKNLIHFHRGGKVYVNQSILMHREGREGLVPGYGR